MENLSGKRIRCLNVGAVHLRRQGHAPAAHHRHLQQPRVHNLWRDRLAAAGPHSAPGPAAAEHSATCRTHRLADRAIAGRARRDTS